METKHCLLHLLNLWKWTCLLITNQKEIICKDLRGEMFRREAGDWAHQTFGECNLGDERRTKRLVEVGKRLANQIGCSLPKCCEGDKAALLGSYRLLRNDAVNPEAIRAGGFVATACQAQEHAVLLAVEDTTILTYEHAVASQLGTTSNNPNAKRRGDQVHSVLLLDALSEQTVGLIEQSHWCREVESYGKKHQRKKRAYQDKESYKWEQASVQVEARLGAKMAHTISVCDREADVYEYLSYKLRHSQRFVVRAKADRRLWESQASLFETLKKQSTGACCYTVQVTQRGGRPARTAKLSLRGATLTLRPPSGSRAEIAPLCVKAVLAEEIEAPANVEPLRWVLLTTEAVASPEQALAVVRYYECRWRIEDYHKAWKSGVGVERQRFQSPDNLARMIALTAFLAVRLLQLRESQCQPAQPCDTVLNEDEWQVLWTSTEHDRRPTSPPTLGWAYLALAKLGGFTDTKRTGRPGWDTLWHGWFRLQERVKGYQISQFSFTDL
ncbi:IS4 family transposase [Candidatus Glomeribacter gigasporarum]|nr:IS4 family transposase [Candidatus Glomeribacter gigasporarum]